MKRALYWGRNRISPPIVIIGLIVLLGSGNIFAGATLPAPNQGAEIGSGAGPDVESRALPAAESAKPAATQAPPGSGGFRSLTGSLTTALLFVLVIIFLAAWIVKRAYPGSNLLFGSLPVLQVLGRTHLGPKQTLALVRLDGKLLLLGVTDHAINPVLTIEEPEEVSRLLSVIEQNRPAGITAGFRHFFSREATEIHRHQEVSADSDENLENLNEEKDVLQLKNELNSLINKVEKLKGIGGQGISG